MFDLIENPKQLMQYLDKHFEYGVIDKCGNKHTDSNSDDFQNACNNDWRVRSVKQMLKDGVGHCYDQVEIERQWFEDNGFKVKTFWISAYQEGIDNSGFSHTYLLFEDNQKWCLFEHSDFANRGIHAFNSVEDAIRWQACKQIKFASNCIKPKECYSVCIKQYEKPAVGLDMGQYLDFVNKGQDVCL